jgi:hypothetical protein
VSDSSETYFEAYETARCDLVELIAEQQRLEKKKLALRKTLESLGALCASEGIEVDPSTEAANLLENSKLADEIRTILEAEHPNYISPHSIKTCLEGIGWDLTKYGNPQAAIQMVLKRWVQSGEVYTIRSQADDKQLYRIRAAHTAQDGEGAAVEEMKTKIQAGRERERKAEKAKRRASKTAMNAAITDLESKRRAYGKQ